MSTNLYIQVRAYNAPTTGWVVDAWPASAFPINPVLGTHEPVQSSPTATVTTDGDYANLTGLTADTQYWLCVKDPIAFINRWYPADIARLGNADTDPFIITIPIGGAVATADILLDLAVGSLAQMESED